MHNDARSDRPGGPGNDDGGTGEGFSPTPKQIVGAVVAVLLLVFIAINNETTKVSFLFVKVTMPLWAVLAITAVIAFGVGMLFGSRRTKRKLVRD